MRLIIDGDYPMAYGAFSLDRDLTLPISEARSVGDGSRRVFPEQSPDSEIMATLPEMRRAGIAAALVKVTSCILKPDLDSHGECRNRDIAYALGQGQLAYYRILDSRGEARLLKTSEDFNNHMRTWSEKSNYDQLPVGMVIGMEGADTIHWPEKSTSGMTMDFV